MDSTPNPESGVEDAAEPPTEAANDTVLHVACEFGGAAVVEHVLNLHPEMAKARNANGETPMHKACMGGNPEELRMLVESNQWVASELDDEGRSPLYLACHYDKVELVKHLLRYKWVLGSEEDAGFCLRYAVSKGHKDILEQLMEVDPTLALKTNDKGDTALHIAVSEGRFEIAEYLISNTSVEVDAQNGLGQTALDILQDHGHLGDESDTDGKAKLQSLLVKGRVEYGPEKGEETIHETPESPRSVHIYLHDEENPEPNDVMQSARSPSNLNLKKFIERNKSESKKRRDSLIKMRKRQHKAFIKMQRKQQEKHEMIYIEALQNARNTITIVAVLIATVTFAAGVSPPGGVYQDGAYAGKSTLAKTRAFKVFMISNTLALFISLGLVIVLVSIIPFKRKLLMRILTYSHKVMWVAVSFMATAFVAAAWATMPDIGKKDMEWAVVALLTVAVGTLGGVFLGWGVTLVTHTVRKAKWRREVHGKGGEDNKPNKKRVIPTNFNPDTMSEVSSWLVQSVDFSDNSNLASSGKLGFHPV